MEYFLSNLDEKRFDITTAKAIDISLQDLPNLHEFCQRDQVRLLIVRCSTQEIHTIHALEQNGFLLMDTLVNYLFDFLKKPIPSRDETLIIRPFEIGEANQIKSVAKSAFKNYLGHYHADPRLPRDKCDEVYVSWAYRSCIDKGVADEVLVAISNKKIVGFVTLKMTSTDTGECIHGGVVPNMQGKGIYREFIIRGLEWCQSHGADKMIVSTQINNAVVQKVWIRLGFEFNHAVYTFHKWFDD